MNAALATFCAATEGASWLDAGAGLLGADGQIEQQMMPDALHPSAEGETAMDSLRAAYVKNLLQSLT